MRTFPEPIRNFCQFWFRIQYGIHTKIPSIWRIFAAHRHVFYSFSLYAKDGYCKWIQTITKLQIREVYTNIQLNCYINPPWNTRSFDNFSRTQFLKTFLESNFKWRTASRRTLNIKLVFAATGLTGTRIFLPFAGLDKGWLEQGRPNLYCYSIDWTSPTSTTSETRTVVRGAASPTADDATVSYRLSRGQLVL